MKRETLTWTLPHFYYVAHNEDFSAHTSEFGANGDNDTHRKLNESFGGKVPPDVQLYKRVSTDPDRYELVVQRGGAQ